MKSNIFLRFITALVLMLYVGRVDAANISKTEALDFARTKGKELLMNFQETNLQKRYAALDDLFVTYIDVDYISKFVIGKYWKVMSKAQREAYQKLFVRYGLAYYKTLPLDFANNLTYDIIDAEDDKNFTNVSCVVKFSLSGNQPQNIALIFRLHRADGIIKAVDVKVAESSMLLYYRNKFYKMLAENDDEIDWFLEDLEDMTRSFENNLQENVSSQQNSLEFDEETL
ncbi:MAG: ABC transporter substrate-binding protein [Alphaproteobacteria bacterium]|nr:ABC transporter substrate-binding protein [Alphaproteobacteria bacterium]MBQ9235284.1 ABC transporter substrate-binding protein [Alphaproteobacteria bacterium]